MSKTIACKPFLCLLLFFCFLAARTTAQNTIRVSGVVKDRLDKVISDVSVTIQGNSKAGTTTNEKGEFTLQVSASDVLVFSYVGFIEVTRPVNNTIFFEVVMDAKQGSQEEVVVVGFGKAKKISLVGAQSTVNVTELKQPVANLSTVLAGRVAGVVGVQRTGLPGTGT